VDEDRAQPEHRRAAPRLLGSDPPGGEERHRSQDGGRGVHQQRAGLADAPVPRSLRGEHAGGSLVQYVDDAEGHDARPRARPPGRRPAADRIDRQRVPHRRPGDGDGTEGLRRDLQRPRQALRSVRMTPTAAAKATGTEIGSEKLLTLYRQMVAIRLFEERVNDLYTRALMPGLAHL